MADGNMQVNGNMLAELGWDIMLEMVQHMDPMGRSTWRLVSKAACQAVYESTRAISPTLTTSTTAIPLPLLSKCSGVKQLSCAGLRALAHIDGLPAGLELLDISGTRVMNPCPLLQCTALQQLSATGMHAQPTFLQQLPPILQQLTGLQQLDLSYNDRHSTISNECLQGLAAAIQQLVQLQCLSFAGNRVGAGGAHILAQVLQQLTLLQQLDLGGTRLTDGGVQALCPVLRRLTALQRLDLRSNEIGAEGAQALAPALQQLTTLCQLNLSANRVGVEGAQALAPALQQTTRLQQLNLTDTAMFAEGAQALAPVLLLLTGLQRLDLGHNDVGVEGAQALAPALQLLTGLQQLHLASNCLYAEGAHALAPALHHLTGLRRLDLRCNHVGAEGAQALAPALQQLRGLQQLDLGYNEMLGGVQALAPALQQLAELRQLDLTGNYLGAEGVRALAPVIGMLQPNLTVDASHQDAALLQAVVSALRRGMSKCSITPAQVD